jgi:tetratricopeptide (TPR) repeat protein
MYGREIYDVVEELSQFSNICLGITSRISTIPPSCETLDIPTLSMEAARDTFYHIYKNDKQPDLVNRILEQLEFHPLSITLLATVGHHSKWDTDRLTREWEGQRTAMLRTKHNNSLAAAIELSLASPMFQELGPDARGLLGVIAFFPQGVDENNLNWLFPTLPNRTDVFDDFCILSLTHRTNGFVTMLAPLRDYLCPKDPASSPPLLATKDRYFSRLSIWFNPGDPGFEEARWIVSEDVNVEHLLDVFTAIAATSVEAWDTSGYFMRHLYWHKKRFVILGPKIEGLPDTHPSKPGCLVELSRLFYAMGSYAERKRLLVHGLKLWRQRGNDFEVAGTLRFLADANRILGLHKEGIEHLKEALEIYKRRREATGEAYCWHRLATLLYEHKQLDAAEVAATQAIMLLSSQGEQYMACQCYRVLGNVCHSKGEIEKAIYYFNIALGIAASFGWQDHLFWVNYRLAELFFGEKRFNDAHAHVERAKPYTVNDPYLLGTAMELQARFWYDEGKFEEAMAEALRAADLHEKTGATDAVERCRATLQDIEGAMNNRK